MKAGLDLSKESLDKLLVYLDADRERAGQKYETLRLGLIRFFEWRGCLHCEEHADETIDRVARKIEQGEDIRNIHGYVAGVARFRHLEILRERKRVDVMRGQIQTLPPPSDEEEDDARMDCVRRCLEALPADDAQAVTAYYRGDAATRIEGRKTLAGQLGVSLNTLRMRMQRLRARLEDCIVECAGLHPGAPDGRTRRRRET